MLQEVDSERRSVDYMFAILTLTMSDEWSACQDLALSFTVPVTTETAVVAGYECLEYDSGDPCCSASVEFEECCAPREQDTTVFQLLPGSEDAIAQVCMNPDCISTFVDSYRRSYQDVYVQGICHTDSPLSHRICSTGALSNCLPRILGSDLQGVPCSTDDDCLVFGSSGRCDISSDRCTGITEELQKAIVTCLVSHLDSPVRTSLQFLLRGSKWRYTPEPFSDNSSTPDPLPYLNATLEELLYADALTSDCISDFGPLSPLHSHFTFRPRDFMMDETCEVCTTLSCLSTAACEFPVQVRAL